MDKSTFHTRNYIEMKPQDLHPTGGHFTDPINGTSFWQYAISTQQPVTCHYIPQSTPGCEGFMAECKALDGPSPYLLSAFGHYYDEYEGQKFAVVVTEPVKYNLALDLDQRRQAGRRYTEEEIKAILRTCLEGLKAISSNSMVDRGHGNLTLSSVFMTERGHYALGSFNSQLTFNKQGMYANYLHPRASQGNVSRIEADLFALAVLLAQLGSLTFDCQIDVNGPALNRRKAWESLQYLDRDLADIWVDLSSSNSGDSAASRLAKHLNLLSAPAANQADPRQMVKSLSHALPAPQSQAMHMRTVMLTSQPLVEQYPQPCAYVNGPFNPAAPLHLSMQSQEVPAPVSQVPPSYQLPPQPSVYEECKQPVSQDMFANIPCSKCQEPQAVVSGAVAFICRVCLKVNRLV